MSQMRKKLRQLAYLLFTFLLIVNNLKIHAQTFTNNTASAYNTWNSANAWGTALSKTVVVSGLTNPLAVGTTVLKQVNLNLGDGTSGLNMSTYAIRLKSPIGTTITIVTAGDFAATSITNVNIKFRDDALLTFPNSSLRDPFEIGYYKVSTAGSFATVNGENPNGNWTLEIIEGTASEIAFVSVDLVFGTAFKYTDITATTTNDVCATPQCMSAARITKATINAYTGDASNDPNIAAVWPSGCQWNAARNNSGWFYFRPNATTCALTISGVSATIQSLVVSTTNNCTAGSQTVPTGGCPTDAVNDTYESPQYTSSSGAGCNQQFNLSGLTAGNDYFLVIDGNGGAISSLYIEMTGSLVTCAAMLPIELITFNGEKQGSNNELNWVTATEINNDYFTVENSIDGINFTNIGVINGAGNSILQKDYHLHDYNVKNEINYYRLKQTDFDGKQTYSDLISIDNRLINDKRNIILKTNLFGQEINENYRGLVIISFSDGTSTKVIQ